MKLMNRLEGIIRTLGIVTAWATVVPIAFFTGLQMLDRKLQLGVSAILPDLSTSLLFILIFMTLGFTYLRDGHVRVDVFRRKWSSKTLARIELVGCLFVLLPLSIILVYYGWDGLMRTTKFAETDIWAQRIAAVGGPALLGIAGVIVVVRNVSFLRGHRSQVSPNSIDGVPHDK